MPSFESFRVVSGSQSPVGASSTASALRGPANWGQAESCRNDSVKVEDSSHTMYGRGHVTIETQAAAPAGWYSDPAESGGVRWWDGARWSTHVRMPEPPATPNPYGLPPIASVQSVSPTSVAGPPWIADPRLRHVTNRGAAYSLGFGAFALALGVFRFTFGTTFLIASWVGIAAIVWGVGALRTRRSGFTTSFWKPILGIVMGAVGTVMMVAGILVSLHAPVLSATTAPAQQQQQQQPIPSQPTVPRGGPPAESDQILDNEQLLASGTLQAIHYRYSSNSTTLGPGQSWPATLTESPDSVVRDANGLSLVTLPAGIRLQYALAADRSSFGFVISSTAGPETIHYDSATNTFTRSCGDVSCAATQT
jgi:hypothetical protein